MGIDLTNISNKESVLVIAISIFMIFLSGIFFGITYFTFEALEEGFLEMEDDFE